MSLKSTQPTSSPIMSAPWWLRFPTQWNKHTQTIWTALYAKAYTQQPPVYWRERWPTPDHDFIDIDWLRTPHSTDSPQKTQQPLMVMFHGLEGSSQSPYAIAMADWCARNKWAYAVAHFRGCSGDINRAPRAYHMGDYQEADWILKRFKQHHAGPVVAVGISLGGNVLLRWATEAGSQAGLYIKAIASICAPLDLVANVTQMDQGFCRLIYTEMFLRTLRQKCEYKIKQYPGLFDIEAIRNAKTFDAFDNAFTAPLHGFKNSMDYWTRNSITAAAIKHICIPSLVLHAQNDPFIPAHALPEMVNQQWVTYLRPEHGGHLGFATGTFPGNLQTFAQTIGQYFNNLLQ